MSFEDNQEKGFTRRTFIKGAALGTVGLASAGLLAGCGASEEAPPAETPTGEAENIPSFLKPPPPIPDSEITETITADVS